VQLYVAACNSSLANGHWWDVLCEGAGHAHQCKICKAACMLFLDKPHISPQSERTYLEEFILKIGPYLHCLLNSEGVPEITTCRSCKSASFEWRCSDCFPALVLCMECCWKSHQLLLFHRVQKWMGKYFAPSQLREVGVHLQFGHSEDPCPYQTVCHKAFHAINPI
jgi:hypothetical protein